MFGRIASAIAGGDTAGTSSDDDDASAVVAATIDIVEPFPVKGFADDDEGRDGGDSSADTAPMEHDASQGATPEEDPAPAVGPRHVVVKDHPATSVDGAGAGEGSALKSGNRRKAKKKKRLAGAKAPRHTARPERGRQPKRHRLVRDITPLQNFTQPRLQRLCTRAGFTRVANDVPGKVGRMVQAIVDEIAVAVVSVSRRATVRQGDIIYAVQNRFARRVYPTSAKN